MEVTMEFEDDLFFAELSKQISLLIMDDDDADPLATFHSGSYQGFHRENNPIAQSPFMYEQSCKSKGTGVFIPQTIKPRRKQHRQRRHTNSYNTKSSHNRQQINDLNLVSSQLSYYYNNNKNSPNTKRG